jgi:hypothetical protein
MLKAICAEDSARYSERMNKTLSRKSVAFILMQ